MSNKDQLLQTIATLPDDLIDQTLTYIQTLQHPIQSTPGVCGGHARIRNTRIPVWTLANQRIPDDQVRQYATATNRILITENRQDFIDLHRSTDNHGGGIIFKVDRDYIGKVKTIADFIAEDQQSLENRLLRVMKQNRRNTGPTFIVQEYPKAQS